MDAGKLRIVVARDRAGHLAATIGSSRPQAAQLFVGQPADSAVARVPRLFSLCGTAQGIAASQALAAARGDRVPLAESGLRALAREAIGEHLWRLCLDWPQLLGSTIRLDEFRRWRQRLLATGAAGDAALAADLLAALPALRPANLPEQRTAAPCRPLPQRAAADWAPLVLENEGFAAAPTWQGQPAETGALARHLDDPEVAELLAGGQAVAARLIARFADLRTLAAGLGDPARLAGWCDAAAPAPGLGLACVETARGLLLHLMQVNDGRVERYVIVAPTEWNFHPQGVFVSELAGNAPASGSDALAVAQRLALSLDPCVSYEVVLEHA